MGYCTRFEFEQAIANVLTTANPTPSLVDNTISITSIGNSISDTISNEEIDQYIRWADENIDAWFSDVYRTPFKRVNRGTFPVAADITAGDMLVYVADSSRFNPGDVVLIRDDANMQELTIDSVPTSTRINFTLPITVSYLAADTNVERIRFPDPIPKMSARLAGAYFFDRHFAAQQDPNSSEFGKHLREAVNMDANLIKSGAIRLSIPEAGEYVGRRYYNGVLDDVPSTKAKPGDVWFKGP